MDVDPDQRDRFLAGWTERLESIRSEPGCIRFVYAADPYVPGRLWVIQHWDSEESLQRHGSADGHRGSITLVDGVVVRGAAVQVHTLSGSSSLFGLAEIMAAQA